MGSWYKRVVTSKTDEEPEEPEEQEDDEMLQEKVTLEYEFYEEKSWTRHRAVAVFHGPAGRREQEYVFDNMKRNSTRILLKRRVGADEAEPGTKPKQKPVVTIPLNDLLEEFRTVERWEYENSGWIEKDQKKKRSKAEKKLRQVEEGEPVTVGASGLDPDRYRNMRIVEDEEES